MSFVHLPAFAQWLIHRLAPLTLVVMAAAPSAAVASLDAVVPTRLAPELRCLLGAYALPGQRSVVITGNNGQPRGLRFTLSNGQFGDLQELANGSWSGGSFAVQFEPCSAGTLLFSTLRCRGLRTS